MSLPSRSFSWQAVRARIGAALRRNAVPGLVLQGAALALLWLYHGSPQVRAALGQLMAWKTAWGTAYSFVTGALFAGILPCIVLRAMGAQRGPLGRELLFGALFWGYRGVEVDWFYRFQAWLFGDAADWRTVLHKTLFDQLVYSIFWVAPSLALVYLWKESGYEFARMRTRLDREFFVLRLPAVTIGNAMVWTPAVVVIYLLPQALQLPVANLIVSFWVLMLVMLFGRGES